MAMCLFAAGNSLLSICLEGAKAYGRPAVLARVHLFMVLVTVAAMVALLPLGLNGVAAGLSVGAVAGGIYAALSFSRVVSMPIGQIWAQVRAPALAAVVMAAGHLVEHLLLHAGEHGTIVGLALLAVEGLVGQATGGRHFNAQNAEQVAAYVEKGHSPLTASGMGGIEARPASPPTTAIVPPQPLPASGPPALHLRALPAPNTEPLGIALYWTVAAEAQPDMPVFGARAANPTVPVAPGRYVIEVRDGPLSAKQTAEVRDNRPATVTMVLNAGMARIRRCSARKTGELCPMLSLPQPMPAARSCWPSGLAKPRHCCRLAGISCAPNWASCAPSKP